MGGISIPQLSGPAITGAGSILVYAQSGSQKAQQAAAGNSAVGLISGLATQFRPPQWSQPALTMITVPAQYVSALNQGNAPLPATAPVGSVTGSASTPPANAVPQYLVFDGVMQVGHSQPMTMTEHPVQDTANLTDHIRANQAMITMDVLMTDVLPAYASGQWVGNASKSISCFETLDALRLNRIPLILTTRLKTYSPVFILDVQPDDTVKTLFGLRCRIQFKQAFLFSASIQTVSARSQTTGNTNQGQTNPTAVPAGVTTQNGLPSTSTGIQSSQQIQSQTGTVIGAGNWSSNNTGQIIPGVN